MLQNFEKVLGHAALFKSVFNNATINAILVMDKDGFIQMVNPAFTNAFGYTTEDLSGKHTRLLFTEEDQAAQMPEMEIEKVNQHGFAIDRNYTVVKNGSCVWVTGESILSRDENGQEYIVKFIQDIHQQKLLEKFLKESKEFSDSIVTSISDAIIVFDLHFRILNANNAFYNLFNLHDGSVEGLYLFELKNSPFDSERLKPEIEKVIETGSPAEFQIKWVEENNVQKYIAVKASLLDGKLVNKRIVLVLNDITEKISSQQQRDDLLAFVIHEIRNPLNNISLCNMLLEQSVEDNDKEEAADLLQKVKTNTLRINALIQELYDATQAGAGHLNFNKTSFLFDDMVSELIDEIQLANPNYVIDKTGNTGAVVKGDRFRISQTLSNYMLNAIKYSPGANKIDVLLTVENGHVVVGVKDYGQGIAEDQIPHLFERYFRADNTTKIEGLGLGLYLSKQIIDAHNGRVWVKSRLNEGSTFYFSVPKL